MPRRKPKRSQARRRFIPKIDLTKKPRRRKPRHGTVREAMRQDRRPRIIRSFRDLIAAINDASR